MNVGHTNLIECVYDIDTMEVCCCSLANQTQVFLAEKGLEKEKGGSGQKDCHFEPVCWG